MTADTLNPRNEITTTAAAMVPTVAIAFKEAWHELSMNTMLGIALISMAISETVEELEDAPPTDIRTAIQDAWRVFSPQMRELVFRTDHNEATADRLREMAVTKIRAVDEVLAAVSTTPTRRATV
jgi:hypothetical protein